MRIIISGLLNNRPINNCHRQEKAQIEEALHSIKQELRVLAGGSISSHRAKMSTLKSREVEITKELELIEAQIGEILTRRKKFKCVILPEPRYCNFRNASASRRWENICGIVEILKNSTWGRTEPSQ